MPLQRARRRAALAVSLAASLAACGDTSAAGPGPIRLDPAYVTGAAAAALGGDGRFALPDSVINPRSQLSEAQARSIASDYVKAFHRFFAGQWTREHGAHVTPSELRPCDRALYAASAYKSIDPGASEITQRTLGPHWIVPMCGATRQLEVVVSFSSLSTELGPSPSASESRPWERTDFLSFGVPQVAIGFYSPEGAAERTFKNSRKRVAAVPELVMAGLPSSPVLVRWRVGLESQVRVKGAESGVSRDRATLFVGFADTFYAAGLLDRNPQATSVSAPIIEPSTKREIRAILSPLAPVNVELVTREAQ